MANAIRPTFLWFPLLTILLFPSCKVGYVLDQGTDFFHLMSRRRPVSRVLEEEDLGETRRKNLRTIQEVRSFAENQAGLSVNDAYTTYVHLDRGTVSWNITATPRYRIRPLQWWFPIVGSFPYIGFFDRGDAVEYRDELVSEGYDVHTRPVSAFSTLGWFSDPVYSPMLNRKEPRIVDTVFHELVHRNVFFTDRAVLNESIASEIGRIAALSFLKDKYGEGTPVVRWTRNYQRDISRLQRFFLKLRNKLQRTYQKDRSDSWKRRRKRRIFMRARRSYLNLTDRMETKGWTRLLSITWNNAFVASNAVYHRYANRIRLLWSAGFEKDLRKTVQFLRSLDDQNPLEHINRRIEKGIEGQNQDQSIPPAPDRTVFR